MRILPLVLLSLFSLSCFSQNNELLRSRGVLPGSIVGTSQQQNAYEVQKRRKRDEEISNDQYKIIHNSVEFSQAIAQSGRLMINDSLSSYTNKILDKLLKDDPSLRKQLCVYFYYSPGTNAITLDNGMIIVELGLMAHLKNEAQLAFILSHEVCHYREKHFLKYFQYSKKQKRASDPLSRVLSYSRELEQEADSLGFLIYESSGYALSEAVSVFEMLRNSDMPEEQIPFTPVFFEHDSYHFPVLYYLDSLEIIDKTDINETLSTHPSCEKRMQQMQLMKGDSATTGDLFLVSKNAFNVLRHIAREECCSIYLESRDYGNAIYCSYALLIEDSTDELAKKNLGKALYNLAAYRIEPLPVTVPEHFIIAWDKRREFYFGADDTYEPVVPYGQVSGESQRMHYFLNELNSTETTVLALDWNWKLFSASGYKDPLLATMCDNLLLMINAYSGLSMEDFTGVHYSQKETEVLDKRLALKNSIPKDFRSNPPKGRLTDSDKDFTPQKKAPAPGFESILNPDYCFRAFDKILQDSVFVSCMERQQNLPRLASQYDLRVYSISDVERKDPSGLGISGIYILPPSYYFLKEYKRTRIFRYNITKSGNMEKQQESILAASAKSAKKGYEMLTPEKMDSADIADYNSYCMLRQWMSEADSHFSNSLAMNLSHIEMGDSIIRKTGKQYVLTSSVISEKHKRIRHIGTYVIACIIPWTLPAALIYGVIPKNRCKMEIEMYDLKTGKIVLIYEDIKKTKASSVQMQSFYSKVFTKISRKPKVK
jgi:hypothetical protein